MSEVENRFINASESGKNLRNLTGFIGIENVKALYMV